MALALVVVALFRPSLFVDRVFPPYQQVSPVVVLSEAFAPEPGQIIRFHVTRETAYGDRLRLFAITIGVPRGQLHTPLAGVSLVRDDGGRWVVQNMAFDSRAAKSGMEVSDVVTAIDVERQGLPPKELVYPLGLLLLGLVFLSQHRRLHAIAPSSQLESGG